MQNNSSGGTFEVNYNYTSQMLLTLEEARELFYAGVTEGKKRQSFEDWGIRSYPDQRKSFEQYLEELKSVNGIDWHNQDVSY